MRMSVDMGKMLAEGSSGGLADFPEIIEPALETVRDVFILDADDRQVVVIGEERDSVAEDDEL